MTSSVRKDTSFSKVCLIIEEEFSKLKFFQVETRSRLGAIKTTWGSDEWVKKDDGEVEASGW